MERAVTPAVIEVVEDVEVSDDLDHVGFHDNTRQRPTAGSEEGLHKEGTGRKLWGNPLRTLRPLR